MDSKDKPKQTTAGKQPEGSAGAKATQPKTIIIQSETVEPASDTPKATDNKTAKAKPDFVKPRVKMNDITKVKSAKTEKGLVVSEKPIDPELALMANRTASAERQKFNQQPNGKGLMSDVVRQRRRQVNTAYTINAQREKAAAERREQRATAESVENVSKLKSALFGVGVAVIVAVIGFAGIAIFGNDKKMCTVHFESNGGSEVAGTEFVCGRTVKQPEDPVKEGFSFEGWIYEGDPFDFSIGLYKNATLVAKWQANEGTEIVTVTFDSDGGSAVSSAQVSKGSPVGRPNAPTKYGQIFDDWYLDDKVYDFDSPVTKNITLKAHWKARPVVPNNNTGNNVKPIEKKRAESITLTGGNEVTEKSSAQLAVTVLPSTAEVELIVSSSDNEIASCSVTGTAVTCAGNKPGTATITVKDNLSGNQSSFVLTVSAHEHVYGDDHKCTICGQLDPDHVHTYVDGKCSCGATDPDYHEHTYGTDHKCTTCGQLDPNHTTHDYVNGKCSCGAIDPNHQHSYGDNNKCTICGQEKPNDGGTNPPEEESDL